MAFKLLVTYVGEYKSIKNNPETTVFTIGKSSATNLRLSAFICG